MKKIAFKMPCDFYQGMAVLPFLHQLHADFGDDAEIHMIGDPKRVSFLSIIPFTVHFHEFHPEEMKDIFTVHRGVANIKALFKVDIYFALTSQFLDCFIGLNLRARSRVGFKEGFNSMVLTNRVEPPVNVAPAESYFRLLSSNTNKEYEEVPKVISKRLDRVCDEDDYYVVNLTLDSEGRIDERWIDFLSLFEQEVVYIVCEKAKSSESIWLFYNKLQHEGIKRVKTFTHERDFQIACLMANAKAVLSENSLWGHVSAYTGVKTALIYDDPFPQNLEPYYFQAELLAVSNKDQTLQGPLNVAPNPLGSIDTEILFDRFMAFVENRDQSLLKLVT